MTAKDKDPHLPYHEFYYLYLKKTLINNYDCLDYYFSLLFFFIPLSRRNQGRFQFLCCEWMSQDGMVSIKCAEKNY
jgi:hypothetical protein